MILADTSIWIDHLRKSDLRLRQLLGDRQIVIHPLVIGELALGSLKDRAANLALLDLLPRAPEEQWREVRHMIEARRLHGRGIGWVDACLIASVLIGSSTRLWTRDKNLRKVAARLGVNADLA